MFKISNAGFYVKKTIFCAIILSLSIAFCNSALAAGFTFVSMADSRDRSSGPNMETLPKIVALAKNDAPAFVLFGGDPIYGGKGMDDYKRQMDKFINVMNPLSQQCKIYYSYGNHEIKSAEQQEYLIKTMGNPTDYEGRYKGLVYSFDHCGSHFICITTMAYGEKNLISDEQMKWLEADLEKAKNSEHIFVFGHSPAFPAGPHLNDSLDSDKAKRDKFWLLLTRYNVDVYFCGHEHLYYAKKVGTVYQMLNGSCGAPFASVSAQLSKNNFYHYVRVEIDGPEVKMTAIDDCGKVRDMITLTRKIMPLMRNNSN